MSEIEIRESDRELADDVLRWVGKDNISESWKDNIIEDIALHLQAEREAASKLRDTAYDEMACYRHSPKCICLTCQSIAAYDAATKGASDE